MKKLNIQLEELICPMCSTKIENGLKKEAGIESASISYNSAKAKVTYDETLIDVDRILAVITDLGYDVISWK